MRNAAGLAWTSFIASLGQAVPNMLQQYNHNLETERTVRKRNQAETDVAGILQNLPKIGAAPAGMEPAQAMDAWLKSSPEDKMKATQILSGQPVSAAQKAQAAIPKMPFPEEGGALQSFTNEPGEKRQRKNAFIKRFMEAVGSLESDSTEIGAHPRAKNGLQAWGKFGVVPELHAQRVGLNPQDPKDIALFQKSPDLQRAAGESFVQELGEKYNWDPAMMRRGYYGITANNDAPQYLKDGTIMPSSNEDNAKFMSVFQGVERPVSESAERGGFPYDNSALQALAKPPAPQRKMPRVGYQDQERFLLENIKNPAQLGLLKDFMGMVSRAADDERTRGREDRQTEQDNTRDWRSSVVEESRQRLEVWKTKYAGATRRGAAKDAALANLKELRTTLQKQLSDMSAWQLNYLKADEDQREILASQFPEFFTSKPETSFWGGTKQVKGLDPNKYEKEVLRLRELINSIGAEIAPKGGVEYIPGEAGKTAQPSDYFIN